MMQPAESLIRKDATGVYLGEPIGGEVRPSLRRKTFAPIIGYSF
jgi:hypothetical protein